MVRVSLTNFLDFSAASGAGRLTQVKKAKKQDDSEYNPATDFWRPLRTEIQSQFEAGWRGKDSLAALRDVTADGKKQERYAECIKGVGKWAARPQFGKSRRQSALWSYDDLQITVNPELDLDVDGTRTAIKLYFRAEQLRKRRADTGLYLLSKVVPKARPAILDVPRGKLVVPTVDVADLDIVLEGEVAQFLAMWRRL